MTELKEFQNKVDAGHLGALVIPIRVRELLAAFLPPNIWTFSRLVFQVVAASVLVKRRCQGFGMSTAR